MNRIINIVAQSGYHSSPQRQLNEIVHVVFVEEGLGKKHKAQDIHEAIKQAWELYMDDWDDKTEQLYNKALRAHKIGVS